MRPEAQPTLAEVEEAIVSARAEVYDEDPLYWETQNGCDQYGPFSFDSNVEYYLEDMAVDAVGIEALNKHTSAFIGPIDYNWGDLPPLE